MVGSAAAGCGAPAARGTPGAAREVRAWSPLRVGLLAAAVAGACYAATLTAYGPVSDEGNYFESSRRLAGWVGYLGRSLAAGEPARAFADPVLDETWRWGGPRIPHPPFSRELAALSGMLFFGRMDPISAYRVLGILVAALLVGGVAAWGARRAGPAAGLCAGAAFLFFPRVFAHAHFADTDFLLSALVFFSLFWAAEGRRAPMAGAGVLWGLALATKFSAVLLPLALLPWLFLFRRTELRRLPAFALAALVAFAAVNPVLWVHPLEGLREYAQMGLGRRHMDIAQLPTFYLGRLYVFRPPWHYPLVMLALTAPLGILLLAGAGGAAGLARRASRPVAAMCLLVTLCFIGALEAPAAPLHDDVRLFLSVFPFLALLAGLGAGWALAGFATAASASPAGSVARRQVVGALAVAAALGGAALATARLHPFQASYFNALAGGVSGADRLGLEVTGLKEVLSRDVYADLNRVLPPGATLDGGPFLYEDLLFAQDLGWLAPRVGVRPGPPADYVLVVNRRGWLRASDRALLHFAPAAYALTVDGIPLVALFRLR
ncbi:MAG TPA: glycosyltransferase 87 family protein [Gemmatimonadota bacterium]